MKARIVIYSIIVLAVCTFFTSTVFAECQPGKTAVTIVNPAGRVIEICVPDDAVDHVGGPSDIVIPAVCPCFTPESIDICAREIRVGGFPCTDMPGTNIQMYLKHAPSLLIGASSVNGGWCSFSDRYSSCVNDVFIEPIAQDEFEACYEILINSDMWALNCDGF